MKKQTKVSSPKVSEPVNQWFPVIQWAGAAWLYFVLYKYLHQYPLILNIFESIFPSQTIFPTFSIVLFYLKGIVLWIGILLSSLTAGFLLTKPLKIEWDSSLERFIFSTALGCGALSILILALASLHWITSPVLWGLWLSGLVSFSLIFLKNQITRYFLKECLEQSFNHLFGNQNPLIIRIFIWTFLALSFIMTLVPELFYDALVYHLGAPNLYLQERGLVRIPGATSKFPLLWQMFYLWGLGLLDEMIPKLMHWSCGVWIVLGCCALSKRIRLTYAGLAAGLIFISMPMAQMNIWTSGIDIASCLFSLLSVYAALCYANDLKQPTQLPDKKESHWLILSAILSGFSFGSKYQGGITAMGVFLCFFTVSLIYEPANFKKLFKNSFLYLGVFFIAILPWLLKNIWDTGNPLYPFASSLFKKIGTQNVFIDPEQWQTFINENRRFITETWKDFWKLPWLWTFKDRNQSSLSYPGPVLLSLLPFCLLCLKDWKERWLGFCVIFLLLFFGFSLNSTHLTRYHIQGYPILCFVLAAGLSFLWRGKNLVLKWGVAAAFSILMLENLQTSIFVIQNSYLPWDVVAGKETRENYRKYTHPGLNPYPSNIMFRWMEKNMGANSRTLVLGESKTFDLKLPCLYSDVHGQNPVVLWSHESSSPEELLKKFQDSGITHLLINFQEARRTYGYKMLKWDEKSIRMFDDFWKKYVKIIHREMIPEKFFRGDNPIFLCEIMPQPMSSSGTNFDQIFNPMVILENMRNQ